MHDTIPVQDSGQEMDTSPLYCIILEGLSIICQGLLFDSPVGMGKILCARYTVSYLT